MPKKNQVTFDELLRARGGMGATAPPSAPPTRKATTMRPPAPPAQRGVAKRGVGRQGPPPMGPGGGM